VAVDAWQRDELRYHDRGDTRPNSPCTHDQPNRLCNSIGIIDAPTAR
jgi:hypothetical protein